MMAANIAKSGGVTEGWAKWQIAVAVGTPIAIGAVGVWFYRSRSRSRQGTADSKSKGAKKHAENKHKQVIPHFRHSASASGSALSR